ncbi:M20/M25/M40 family metallo-hydrolase [soil metagenome]
MTPPARPNTATDLALLLALLRRICETPAPTFSEQVRGDLVAEILLNAGLEPQIDRVGNVTAQVPGGNGLRVLVAAHLDTVFPLGTDVTVKEVDAKLAAPGIGDNSASLAVMLRYAQTLAAANEGARPRLTLAATVGEEGLGDLRGIRELMTHAHDYDMVVALDGHLGTIVNRAVGSKRFEVTLKAAGGHSWGDYPSESAVHALGDTVHALTRLDVPREPRSSLNVGQVSGGTSVNAIAQEARFNLDLRSLDADVLARLERDALRAVKRVARQHNVTAEVEQVGDRPAAKSDNEALVRAARAALQTVDVAVREAASSTDANAAMAAGLPAISFGVYNGGDAHRLSEWLEPASLLTGYRAFEELLKNLVHLEQS